MCFDCSENIIECICGIETPNSYEDIVYNRIGNESSSVRRAFLTNYFSRQGVKEIGIVCDACFRSALKSYELASLCLIREIKELRHEY